jgi:hypothetical protein
LARGFKNRVGQQGVGGAVGREVEGGETGAPQDLMGGLISIHGPTRGESQMQLLVRSKKVGREQRHKIRPSTRLTFQPQPPAHTTSPPPPLFTPPPTIIPTFACSNRLRRAHSRT